jgi:hypothetical protein
MEELGQHSTYLHVAGSVGPAGALAGSNHHVARSRGGGGGTGRSRARGTTGRSREHSRRSTRSRGSTRRNEPCCPCCWIWRGGVGTWWIKTSLRRSTRRSARSDVRSRSRHGLVAVPWGCLAAAFSLLPSHRVADAQPI